MWTHNNPKKLMTQKWSNIKPWVYLKDINTGCEVICSHNVLGLERVGLTASALDFLFAQARVHFDKKPQQSGLNHDHGMTLSLKFHPVNVSISYLRGSKRLQFNVLLLLLCHLMPFNDGNHRLKIPVIKGRCASDAPPNAFKYRRLYKT